MAPRVHLPAGRGRAPKATGSRARGVPKSRARGRGNRPAAKPPPGGVRMDTNRVIRMVVNRGAPNLGRSRARGLPRPPARTSRRLSRAPEARERRVRTNRGARTPRPRKTPGHGNGRVRGAATTGVVGAMKDRTRKLGRGGGRRVRTASTRAGSPRSLRRAPLRVRRRLVLRHSPAPRPSPAPRHAPGLRHSPARRPSPAPPPSLVPPRRSCQVRRRRRQREAKGYRDGPPRFAHAAARGSLLTRTVVQCGGSTGVLGPSRSEFQLPWRRSGSRPGARQGPRTGGKWRGAPRGTVAPRHSSARSRGSSTWSPGRCGS